MAVHNGAPYLLEAVQSILDQTLGDFEFIVVDDASSDESRMLIESLKNERIELFVNAKQQGLSKSLNRGIEAAGGEYIARMDHDDVSMRSRLAEQVAFLEENSEVDIVGTWARTIGRAPEQTWQYPAKDADIRSEFVFNSCLVHSSVMWRRSVFEKHGLAYDPNVKRAQDYELWTRAKQNVRFANIPKVLLQYRIHQASVGSRFGDEQRAVADTVREREIAQLRVDASTAELALHHSISRWEFPQEIEGLKALETWLLKLHENNQRETVYPSGAFSRALEQRWWAACRANIRAGLAAWRAYGDSPLSGLGERSIGERATFWAKASLRSLGR